MPEAIEAALRLIRLIQHVYAAIVATYEQLLWPYTVAGAVGREAMQLYLHLLEEAELLEGKHAVLLPDVLLQLHIMLDSQTVASDENMGWVCCFLGKV